MVYEKNKSGDPDYDDKVPADVHAAKTVTAGDGTEVIMTEANGPVNALGEHVNLDDPKGEELDNRPAPGEVATEVSDVQTYTKQDVAVTENVGEAASQAEAEKAVAKKTASRTANGRTSGQ